MDGVEEFYLYRALSWVGVGFEEDFFKCCFFSVWYFFYVDVKDIVLIVGSDVVIGIGFD